MPGLSHKQLENIGFRFVLDALEPSSAYGAAALRELTPFSRGQSAALEDELDNVERMARALPLCEGACAKLERALSRVRDIRASISRCGGEELSEVELFEIKRYLLQLREIAPLFAEIQREAALKHIEITPLDGALELLDPDKTGVASFHVSERYSPELARVRRDKRELEQEIRQNPDDPAPRQKRREAAAREAREELAVRLALSEKLAPFAAAMLENTRAIARLDLTIRKARFAAEYGGTRPRITENRIDFADMTSPKALRELEARGKALTPVSISLAPGATVITGANMGGKSLTLKTLALNVLLSQCGIFPLAKAAETCLFDNIFLLSDDLEDSARGLSSFGGEIARFVEITRAEGFSLVLLDELARGTNPSEGAAIARAAAGYLNGCAGISVLTTHFGGVAERAGAHYRVVGLENADFSALRARLAETDAGRRVAAIAELMDYSLRRVLPGSAPPRDALNICRLLGLREDILRDAETAMERQKDG